MAQLPLERGVSLGKRKILVVDDVMLNRRLLGKMVESLGFDPLYSADGAEAINQFKQMRNEGDLFAILMDVQMPRVDGLEATKEIRSMEAAAAAAKAAAPTSSNDSSCSSASCAEGLRHHVLEAEPPTPCSRRVPIVGVSACTNADQLKSAALQGIPIDTSTERPWEVVGMDLFMAKPVSRDRLAAALQTIREAQAWSAFEASATARASEPLRQPSMLMQAGGDGGASLGAGSAGSGSCDSFASLSGGLDIQVRSRPGGQQVAKRSLGGCMQHALLDTDSASPAKRLKLGRLARTPKEEACRQATCETPTSS